MAFITFIISVKGSGALILFFSEPFLSDPLLGDFSDPLLGDWFSLSAPEVDFLLEEFFEDFLLVLFFSGLALPDSGRGFSGDLNPSVLLAPSRDNFFKSLPAGKLLTPLLSGQIDAASSSSSILKKWHHR